MSLHDLEGNCTFAILKNNKAYHYTSGVYFQWETKEDSMQDLEVME